MDEVTQYNSCKKVVQLNKVIQYLTAHLEDRKYQLALEKKKYNVKEKNLIEKFTKSINKLNTSQEADGEENLEQIIKIYNSKYDVFVSSYREKLSNIKNAVQETEKKVEEEISAIYTILKHINSELETQNSFLIDTMSKNSTEMVCTIKNNELDYKRALALHDEESYRKYQLYLKESEQKFASMELDHQNNIRSISKEFQNEKIHNTPATMKLVKMYKKQAVEYSDLNEENQTKLIQFQTTHFSFLKDLKTKFTQSIKDVNDFVQEKKEEKEKLINEQKCLLESFVKEVLELKQDAGQQSTNFSNEKTLLKNQLKILEDQYINEQKRKATLGTVNAKNANTELSAFKNELNESLKEAYSMNVAEATAMDSRIRDLERKIGQCKDNTDTDLQTIKDEREHELAINSIDVEHENKQFEDELNLLKDKFRTIISKTANDIKNRNELLTEYRQFDDQKRKLSATLQSLQKVHASALSMLDESETSEKEMIFKSFKKETDKENNEFDKAFKAKNGFSSNAINELQSKNDSIINDLMEKHNYKIQLALSNIDKQFGETENEHLALLEKLDLDYNEKIVRIQSEFESLDGYDPSDKYKSLEEYLNDMLIKLRELPSNVDKYRKELNESFQAKLESENERHREALMSFVSQYDQEKLERQIDEQLASLRQSKLEDFMSLDREILGLQQSLQSLIGIQKSASGEALESVEVAAVREQLAEARKAAHKLLRAAEEEFESETKKAKEEIQNQIEENAETKAKETQREDEGLEELHALYDAETRRRKELRNLFAKREEETKENLEKKSNEAIIKYEERCEEIKKSMQKEISDSKSFASSADDDIKERKIYFDEKISNSERGFKLSLEEERKAAANCFPELDSDIERLSKRRDKAKADFEAKPMRSEDESIVANLAKILHQRTQYLTMIGRDLLEYRERMIEQEFEVNTRFGPEKNIGTVRTRTSTRPQTATTRRLPKLNASISMPIRPT